MLFSLPNARWPITASRSQLQKGESFVLNILCNSSPLELDGTHGQPIHLPSQEVTVKKLLLKLPINRPGL